MIRITLSEIEITDINELLDDPETTDTTRKKLLVIRMNAEGAKHGFIAKCLRLHQNSVTNYLKEYQANKLPGITENKYYKPSSSIAAFLPCLRCSFQAAPVADAKQAIQRIKQLTGITLSESQARRTLHKLGMKYRKTAAIPGKCDAQLQFDFYTNELLPMLEEAGKSECKVMFVDAAHFVLGAFLGMIWCMARMFIKTAPGRQRYSVLGAIDSHSHELISVRTRGNINAQSVEDLIEKIRETHPTIPVKLVMDNARYQRCAYVQQAAEKHKVQIIYLPAYSPNLNLIERLWKHTKKKCLTNRYYKNFDAFCEAIDKQLDSLSDQGKELRSLLTLNFQFFQNHKTS
jgi:transposase